MNINVDEVLQLLMEAIVGVPIIVHNVKTDGGVLVYFQDSREKLK